MPYEPKYALYVGVGVIIHPKTGVATNYEDLNINEDGKIEGTNELISIHPKVIQTLKNYTKKDDNDQILYKCGGIEYSIFKYTTKKLYDPLFVVVDGNTTIIDTTDVKIKGVLDYFGIKPVLLHDIPINETLPRGFHEPVPIKQTVYNTLISPVDRTSCCICGAPINQDDFITRHDIQQGKNIICPNCQPDFTIVNTCKNCGLIYKSSKTEDYCSDTCKVRAEDRGIKVILLTEDRTEILNQSVYNQMDEFPTTIHQKIKLTDKITRICPECGTEYQTTRSRLKHGENIYCTKAHTYKHQHDPQVHNKCQNCGIEYYSYIKETYCSKDCKSSNVIVY